ncbi:MAG: hypothetical protein FVQ80_17910 [Planctomycetes bacterium]|nr:hypothetical protein [Planctomycetota bacterium]
MNDLENLMSRLSKKPWKKELSMTVTVRRIEKSDHEYFAYAKSICGRATYFLYFTDDIWGAVVLHNFVEMLRQFFDKENVKLILQDKTIQLKNEYLLSIFSEEQSAESSSVN